MRICPNRLWLFNSFDTYWKIGSIVYMLWNSPPIIPFIATDFIGSPLLSNVMLPDAPGNWTVDAGFAWLAEIHPYTYRSGGSIVYPVKNQGSLDLLASGEVYLIPAWADNVLKGLEEKTLPETVKMYQMSDLALSGTDVDIAICANTPYADACYDFINFVISAEGQKKLVEFMKAVPVIDASAMEQTDAVKAVSELNPAAFNILSTGTNDKEYKTRWLNEIAVLTTEVAPIG